MGSGFQGQLARSTPRCADHGPDSDMDVRGYRRVCWRICLYYLSIMLSAGLLLLLFRRHPRLAVLICSTPCPLALADMLLIRDSSGHQQPVEVLTEEVSTAYIDSLEQMGEMEEECGDTVHLYKEKKAVLRYFVFEGLRYLWMEKKATFCQVSVLTENYTCSELHGLKGGLSHEQQSDRRKVYGPNLIDVPVKSYMQLLLEEVLDPLYMFQVASISLWMTEKYYYYAACIFIISLLSIAITVYEIRKQSSTLHHMAQLVMRVRVRRTTGEEESMNSLELVPGDCVLIPPEGLLLPCDAALLAGECMVNESMLTGSESTSVMKTPLPNSRGLYSPDTHCKHTLFCGTQVIQAKEEHRDGKGVLAIVTRTGFFTAKGELIRSILYSKPTKFRFNRDITKYLFALGFVAFIGTIYSIVILVKVATVKELIIQTLDIVTIVVPPALPAAMTTSIIYAQGRLKKQGVFCISPTRINVCGKVSVFCFDKTGTLTEDGLDMWGVMEASRIGFGSLVRDPRWLPPSPTLTALACCHSAMLVKGQLLGDPLEIKMIESTGWVLEEASRTEHGVDVEFGDNGILAVMRPPTPPSLSITTSHSEPAAIMRRFPFSSSLQRMSVVTVGPGGCNAQVFLKGAPEIVVSLCRGDSVPTQFTSILRQFTSGGFRVLALAYKQLDIRIDIKTIERLAVEEELKFLGLLVMRNLVKLESSGVISTLKQAQIRPIMVTGDNMLTAVNVARVCGMVAADEHVISVHTSPPDGHSPPSVQFHMEDSEAGPTQEGFYDLTRGLYQSHVPYHLVVSGESFSALCEHFPDYLPKVLVRGTVFARMAPEQKTQLVMELQKLSYCVGMCGDGANDCGALKAADVGVSLSEAEASVASPFTSKTDNISSVPLLIQEGRCSLVTSFSLFKFMALYSLIQFIAVLLLYTFKTNLGDWQFLFADLVLVTSLALVMGRGCPSPDLHPQRPPAKLLSMPVVLSLVVHTCLILLGQMSALLITWHQDWYIPVNTTTIGATNLPNLEDTGIFTMSAFQYIFIAVVVTKGYPYKKPPYTNGWFMVVLVVLLALTCWLVVHPGGVVRDFFQLSAVPDLKYRALLMTLALANFFACFLLEVLIDTCLLNCLWILLPPRESKKEYKRLDALLSSDPSWPPLDQPLTPQQCCVGVLS
ncbi:putative cation-transporting ATPase 13A2 isoform X1 [Arapaima gigas]